MHNCYEILLNEIDREHRGEKVTQFCNGAGGAYVETEKGFGFSPVICDWRYEMRMLPKVGMEVGKLARQITSWNMAEASLGLAALNACSSEEGIQDNRVLEVLADYVKGKQILMAGHNPVLEEGLESFCADIHFLAQGMPFEIDYPESAASYLLEKADLLILTENTLIYKELDRFLEIAEKFSKPVLLFGRSVPLSQKLLQLGIKSIISMEPVNRTQCKEEIAAGYPFLPIISYEKAEHKVVYTKGSKIQWGFRRIGNFA